MVIKEVYLREYAHRFCDFLCHKSACTIVMANAVGGHNAIVGDCCQLEYNCTIPENCVVPDQTQVDCNVASKDKAESKTGTSNL